MLGPHKGFILNRTDPPNQGRDSDLSETHQHLNSVFPYFRISVFLHQKQSWFMAPNILDDFLYTNTHSPLPRQHINSSNNQSHQAIFDTHTGKCPNHRPVFSPTLRAPFSERLCYSQSIMDSRRNSFGHPKKFFLFTSHRNLSTHLRTHDFFKIWFYHTIMIRAYTYGTTPLPCPESSAHMTGLRHEETCFRPIQ